DRDDSQQDFTDRGRAPVMEPSSTRAAERSRESEQVRLAKAREAANERAKAERKRIAERKERDAAAKRRRELAQKSKASAQKKGARADTIKSSPGQVAVKQAGNQTGAGESKKSAPTRGDNPRSALLDTNSGTLRMANVSRQPAAAKTSDSKSEKTKAADPTVRENSARKVYSLQIGAFSSRAASERRAATLQKQGFHPYIIESRGKFIVRVGKSDTAKGLWKLETGLRKNQYAPMRVSTEAR
ncbi:MAG: SPOR domain-containing protein, partial [Leptospirales bacterium]